MHKHLQYKHTEGFNLVPITCDLVETEGLSIASFKFLCPLGKRHILKLVTRNVIWTLGSGWGVGGCDVSSYVATVKIDSLLKQRSNQQRSFTTQEHQMRNYRGQTE